MKKKTVHFLSITTIIFVITISTVVASGFIVTQSADDDDVDGGSIIPITLNDYA